MQNHTFSDQLNRQVSIQYPPKRIISLVPSQTELLFELGLENEIIGITKFCIHPKEKIKYKTKIGGTKKLNIEKIWQLKPDLIIGNKEENEKGQVECLMKEFPVWMSDIYTFEDALNMIGQLGMITGKEHRAHGIAKRIKGEFDSLSGISGEIISAFDSMCHAPYPLRIAYFIWKDPYMVAGTNTFINTIINIAGWQNVFTVSRYPEISAEELMKADPQVIFLSSEPYPFKEKHVREFQLICPGTPVLVVDGELFSWYGSRLQYAPAYIKRLKKQIYDLRQTVKSS